MRTVQTAKIICVFSSGWYADNRIAFGVHESLAAIRDNCPTLPESKVDSTILGSASEMSAVPRNCGFIDYPSIDDNGVTLRLCGEWRQEQ